VYINDTILLCLWYLTTCILMLPHSELYLRRPPSANEKYRLDRMLIAAAQRGVKVNIIVYKEVQSVLTRMSHSNHG